MTVQVRRGNESGRRGSGGSVLYISMTQVQGYLGRCESGEKAERKGAKKLEEKKRGHVKLKKKCKKINEHNS